MRDGLILGIMQPYFFPYLGYFDLINCCDKWIVFDIAQYIRHGWINRNRILHPMDGWQYIIIPIKKAKREELISNVIISDHTNWKKKILGQLQHYKKYARYFYETIRLVEECLGIEEKNISMFNTTILDKICEYLEIPFQYEFYSEMNLKIGPIENPGDWALRISEALGASEYVNPPGGREIFTIKKFEKRGIKLTIRDIELLQYGCGKYQFEPCLSIVDVLMWNTPEQVKLYLDEQKQSLFPVN